MGSFTCGGNQCILHCKPPGIGKQLPTFQHEAPRPRFEPAATEVRGENSNHYTTEPPNRWCKQNIKSWDLTRIILTLDQSVGLEGYLLEYFIFVVNIILYCVFILSAISPYTTGLKVLYDPSDCTSTVQLPNY